MLTTLIYELYMGYLNGDRINLQRNTNVNGGKMQILKPSFHEQPLTERRDQQQIPLGSHEIHIQVLKSTVL